MVLMINPKTTISITINIDAYNFHRNAGHNISKLCNDYLSTFVSPDQDNSKIKVLEEKLAAEHKKASEGAVVETRNKQQVEASLTEELLDAKGLRATGGDFGAAITAICEKYDITRGEAISRMERI